MVRDEGTNLENVSTFFNKMDNNVLPDIMCPIFACLKKKFHIFLFAIMRLGKSR